MPSLRMVHKGLFIVGIPLLASIVFCVVLLSLLHQTDSDLQHELKSRQVVAKAGELTHLYYTTLESVMVGAQTGDSEYLKRYDEDAKKLIEALSALKTLVPADSEQTTVVKRIELNSTQLLSVLSEIRQSADKPMDFADLSKMTDIARLRHKVSGLVDDLGELTQKETRALEATPSRADTSRQQLVQFVILGLVANMIVAVLMTVFFSRTITARIALLCRDTVRLVREEPLGAISTASDEIGELDRTLHQVATTLADTRHKERALTSNAPDVICSINEETAFVKLNPACQRVWGYEQGELINEKLTDFVFDRRQLQLSKDVATTFETTFRHKSGRLIDIFWNANWSNQDQLYFCVARDISEKKQAERMKQQLVDMVSHDLRTPLSSINNVLSLLSMQTYGPLSEKALKKIQTAENESARLISLVNNLLEFERMESGQMKLTCASTGTGELVKHSIETVCGLAELKKIAIESNIVDDVAIELDENRITQVLINLLANAIKFSNEGSSITVSVAKEANGLSFKVQDQGKGIAPADQPFLFQRFSQLNQTKASEGAGLGLAICKHIVELHKGTIGVVSDGKNGSCFWFTIPEHR